VADVKLRNFIWKLVMGLTRYGPAPPTRGVVAAEHPVGDLFIHTPIDTLILLCSRQTPLLMGQPNGLSELVLVIHKTLVPI
jgi:hypothetical protein